MFMNKQVVILSQFDDVHRELSNIFVTFSYILIIIILIVNIILFAMCLVLTCEPTT